MIRNVAISLVIVGVVFWLASFVELPVRELISPQVKKEDLEVKQRFIDKKLFEENKGRIVGEELDWAGGKASRHPVVGGAGYVVVGKDGKLVYALNPDKKLPPASLTKLVTAMVAIDLAEEGDMYEVTREAVDMEPTTIMVQEGEKFPLDDLLMASLITSANDAAEVLARGIATKLGGSRDLFVMLMNEKVRRLGLKQTSFKNPTGYDEEGQYSTPRELARIAHYALEHYPAIREMVATVEWTIEETKNHKYYELPNWNGLLGVYPGVDGVKIGYTEEAGYVTIVTSERESERFMVVLLGAPDRWARDNWASQLLNSAFEGVGIKQFRVTRMMVKEQREKAWSEQLQRAKENTKSWKRKDL